MDIDKHVRIGYYVNYNPMKLSMYYGYFEKRTGWNISWVEMTDHRKAPNLLTNHDVDLAVVDSASLARMFTRQARVKLIRIEEGIMDSEALIVPNQHHQSKGGEIRTPLDLRGKRIGVEFGSTAHYALAAYFTEFGVEIMYEPTYQRLHPCGLDQFGKLVPCFFKNQSTAVTFYGMTPDAIEAAYYAGEIHAAYVGFPHLYRMRQNGTVLMTSAECAKWQKLTFRGLVATDRFLARPNAADFLYEYFITLARANFYWFNNTKEFTLYYREQYSVSAKIAAVVPNGYDREVYDHIDEMEYPTMPEQVSKQWMGGGILSRVVYALRDTSILFREMKEDMNVKALSETPERISTQNIREIQLADVLTMEQYAAFIDTSYIDKVLANNVTDAYHLDPYDSIHLGYFVGDVHGVSISVLTADSCISYGAVLTPDILALAKCRCREYYLFGNCPGDAGYNGQGFPCFRRMMEESMPLNASTRLNYAGNHSGYNASDPFANHTPHMLYEPLVNGVSQRRAGESGYVSYIHPNCILATSRV